MIPRQATPPNTMNFNFFWGVFWGPHYVVVGPPGLGLVAVVSYSPTPWRVQYHRRSRA